MPDYEPLTEEKATQYARGIPDLFHANVKLTCREIGDGNLNLVFHIADHDVGTSIILKQALPYAKVVGESWPLTLDRARIESQALLIHGELCPEHVPKVYHFDPDLALTVMEDLSDHIIMRTGLIQGDRFPEFAGHMSDFLARTLFFTSDLGMNQQGKKRRLGNFINPELCKITEELVFDAPFTNADNNRFDPNIQDEVERIWSDTDLHTEVGLLREKFLTRSEALIHGDLHTGSIFVTRSSTKVIDPEFAFYGPMAFDIGNVIAGFLLNYVSQSGWMKDETELQDYRRYLLDTVEQVWQMFDNKFCLLWEEHGQDRLLRTPAFIETYMGRLLQDCVGFAGCEMIRRIIGLAHVADIDTIDDPQLKQQSELLVLSIGKSLILNHRYTRSIQEMTAVVQESNEVQQLTYLSDVDEFES